eukprot:TRINITY_DN14342_c0_g1_i1.p1 TRINITY_DN14342_c0_g1~~TRINITY_DN14342_c0_g1_i1.p1  ORF type:complete len:341 (-),score=44.23 TRINITY_DN14342_c0_g1_i1:145-1167(-)
MAPQLRRLAASCRVLPQPRLDLDSFSVDKHFQAFQPLSEEVVLPDRLASPQKHRARLSRRHSHSPSLTSVPEDGQFDVSYRFLLVGKAAAGLPEQLAGRYEDAYLLTGDSVAKEKGQKPSAAIFCEVSSPTQKQLSQRHSAEEADAIKSSSGETQSAEVLLHVAAKPFDDVPEFSSHADALNAVAVFVVQLPRPAHMPVDSAFETSAAERSDVADLDDQLCQITYFTNHFFWTPKELHPSLNVILLLGHADAPDEPLPPQVQAFCERNPAVVMHASNHSDVKKALANITQLIPDCIARRELPLKGGKSKSRSLLKSVKQQVAKIGMRLVFRNVSIEKASE